MQGTTAMLMATSALLLVALLCLSLTIASCTSAKLESREPYIDVAWDSRTLVLKIANPLEQSILVEDSGLNDQSKIPSGVEIRVVDGAGGIPQTQDGNPDGWWTPLYLESSLLLKPWPMLELPPSAVIERRIDAARLLWGMRPLVRSMDGTCRLQVRATILHSARPAPSVRETDWTSAPCDELFSP
jgi:hypothetical protein